MKRTHRNRNRIAATNGKEAFYRSVERKLRIESYTLQATDRKPLFPVKGVRT